MKTIIAIVTSIASLFAGEVLEVKDWDIQEEIVINDIEVEVLSISEEDNSYSVELDFDNTSKKKREVTVSFEEGDIHNDITLSLKGTKSKEKEFFYTKKIGTPLTLVVWEGNTAYRYLLHNPHN